MENNVANLWVTRQLWGSEIERSVRFRCPTVDMEVTEWKVGSIEEYWRTMNLREMEPGP